VGQLLFHVQEVVGVRSTCPLDISGSPTSANTTEAPVAAATSTAAIDNSEDVGTTSTSATGETPAMAATTSTDLLPSTVTDEAQPTVTGTVAATSTTASEISEDVGSTPTSANRETSAAAATTSTVAASDNFSNGRLALGHTHQQSVASKLAIIQQLSPVPRSQAVRQRKRKVESAEIVTSSPYKQKIISKKNVTLQKASKGASRSNEAGGKKCRPKKKMTCRADKPRGRKPKAVSNGTAKQCTSNSDERGKRRGDKAKQRQDRSARCKRDEDYRCIMCGELYADSRPGEQWIKCMKCSQWCHEDCTGGETSSGFICDFCN